MIETPRTTADSDRYARLLTEARQLHGVSLGRDAWLRLRKNRVAMGALIFLGVLAIVSFLTPFWPLQSPHRNHPDHTFAPPTMLPLMNRTADWLDDAGNVDDQKVNAAFGELNGMNRGLIELRANVFGRWEFTSWCGRDGLGRDLLSRLFWGSRVSLIVGLVAGFVSLVIGVSYGATSGYLGGKIDSAMMRVVDVLYSVPFIFVVIMLITVLSEDSVRKVLESYHINRIAIFFFVVGAIYWLTMARVVRGQVLSLKNEQFVEAARTIGCGSRRIIFVHLVPNLLSVIIVYLTLTIPRVMLFEAFLSFLGLGVEAPDVSWGILANEGTQVITPIKTFWWLVAFPAAALGTTLFALNFLGDGLRDALDPRLKHR